MTIVSYFAVFFLGMFTGLGFGVLMAKGEMIGNVKHEIASLFKKIEGHLKSGESCYVSFTIGKISEGDDDDDGDNNFPPTRDLSEMFDRRN